MGFWGFWRFGPIWAYFWGSGPDLDVFDPILGILRPILGVLDQELGHSGPIMGVVGVAF